MRNSKFWGETSFLPEKSFSHEENIAVFKILESEIKNLLEIIFSTQSISITLLPKLGDFLSAPVHEKGRRWDFGLESKFKTLKPSKTAKSKEDLSDFLSKIIYLDGTAAFITFVQSLTPKDSFGNKSHYDGLLKEVKAQSRKIHSIKNKLIEGNLGLVAAIAFRYHKPHLNYPFTPLDLFQEGSIALYRAIEKFEWSRGIKFSTYASWWVKEGVNSFVKDNSFVIRYPSNVFKKRRKYRMWIYDFFLKNERYPRYEEIQEKFDFEFSVYQAVIDADFQVTSIDAIFPGSNNGSEGDQNLSFDDWYSDPNLVEHHETLASNENRKLLEEAVSKLSPRERGIIEMRFGFGPYHNSDDPIKFDAIAMEQGCSRANIQRIHEIALEKLRKTTKSQFTN